MWEDAHEDPARVCRSLGLVGRSLLTSPLIVMLVNWTPAMIVKSKTAFSPSLAERAMDMPGHSAFVPGSITVTSSSSMRSPSVLPAAI
jgi:hypothetical protein